ncbi:MAG: hypothetical protein J6Y78_09370 [Paludibacteraceae bacterium]|nr:hypothetical protein [Paludibacteraceae bacterium]
MPINIYAYNTTYTLPTEAESTSKVTTPSLMFRKGGGSRYARLFTSTQTETLSDGSVLIHTSSLATLCIHSGDKTYYIPNFVRHIPAGTYTPSAFSTQISKWISLNGTRNCRETFYVSVSGITLTVTKGTTIYYFNRNCSTQANFVGFGTDSTANIGPILNTIASGKVYCVGADTSKDSGFGSWFRTYQNYSITVASPGISFV